MKYLAIALTWLAVATLSEAAKGAIEINSGSVSATVYDHASSATTSDDLNWLDYTAPTTVTASNSGNASATTVNLSTTGAETLISLGMNHNRNGNLLDHARSNTLLYFTATEDLAYSFSGFYNVANIVGANNVDLFFEFRDATSGNQVFYSHQTSSHTPNEKFILGETGGDVYNLLIGNPTGVLTQGHTYLLNFQAVIDAFPNGSDFGASAVGNITLSLTDPSAVPEPTQLVMWLGLGLCGAVRYRLRGRSAVT